MKSSLTPKKSLGQNFLINPRILDKIVSAAEITEKDVVLEIGPGTGNLTAKLAEKARRVIAVEKDEKLIELLKNKFTPLFAIANRGVIVQDDILKFQPTTYNLRQSTYKIVANIPYYITSNLLRTVFEKWPQPKLIVLTVQKEVAQRIIAKPPKMNLLAISVQFFSEPKVISYISKENFRPRPKVDSAIIKLTLISAGKKSTRIHTEKFFKVVRAGFSQKRKQLKNNLQKIFGPRTTEILTKAGINPESRAEELALSDWLKICV